MAAAPFSVARPPNPERQQPGRAFVKARRRDELPPKHELGLMLIELLQHHNAHLQGLDLSFPTAGFQVKQFLIMKAKVQEVVHCITQGNVYEQAARKILYELKEGHLDRLDAALKHHRFLQVIEEQLAKDIPPAERAQSLKQREEAQLILGKIERGEDYKIEAERLAYVVGLEPHSIQGLEQAIEMQLQVAREKVKNDPTLLVAFHFIEANAQQKPANQDPNFVKYAESLLAKLSAFNSSRLKLSNEEHIAEIHDMVQQIHAWLPITAKVKQDSQKNDRAVAFEAKVLGLSELKAKWEAELKMLLLAERSELHAGDRIRIVFRLIEIHDQIQSVLNAVDAEGNALLEK